MSRIDDRERAVRELTATRNVPVSEILRALSPTWMEVGAFEIAELEHRLSANPPPTAEQREASDKARAAAEKAAAEQAQAAKVQRITNARTYRQLRTQNPFAAARFAAENPGAYDPDPGPDAA